MLLHTDEDVLDIGQLSQNKYLLMLKTALQKGHFGKGRLQEMGQQKIQRRKITKTSTKV